MTNYREFYKEHTADAIIAELERLALSLSEAVTRAEMAEEMCAQRAKMVEREQKK